MARTHRMCNAARRSISALSDRRGPADSSPAMPPCPLRAPYAQLSTAAVRNLCLFISFLMVRFFMLIL